MSDPRRPDPVEPFTSRVRGRLARSFEGRRLRRPAPDSGPAAGGDTEAESNDAPGGDRSALRSRRDGVFPVLIALGSALLAVGGVWGWQTWSERSAPPVDDLLPFLELDDEGVDVGDGSPSASADGDARDARDLDGAGAVAEEPGAVDPASESDPAGAVSDTAPVADTVPAGDTVPGAAGTRPSTGDAAGATGTSSEPAEIIVHVSGAVRSPGVVLVTDGSRVYQALELAGGATDRADLDRVNLAAPIADGERIHVPLEGEEIPSVVPPSRPVTAPGPTEQASDPTVDINTATAADLESLPGVGPTIAAAIVQTRIDRGPFLSVDELLDVPGIGEMKLAQISPFAVVGP